MLRPLRAASMFYVETVRNMPLTVHMLLAFFGWPKLGFRYSPFVTAVIVLTYYTAAFVGETIRAGINTVGRGQVEAGGDRRGRRLEGRQVRHQDGERGRLSHGCASAFCDRIQGTLAPGAYDFVSAGQGLAHRPWGEEARRDSRVRIGWPPADCPRAAAEFSTQRIEATWR